MYPTEQIWHDDDDDVNLRYIVKELDSMNYSLVGRNPDIWIV